MKAFYCALAVVAVSAACTGDATSDAGTEAKLSVIADEIFSPNCSATACHGGDGPVRDLKLDADDLHAELVDVESTVSGVAYVVPGDPEASLLYRVLIGDVDSIRQMPPNSPVDDDKVELVKTWIEDGATDD